jgi:hypothetical protein
LKVRVLNQLLDEFAPADHGKPYVADCSVGNQALEVSRFFVAWNPAQLEGITRKSQDGTGTYVAYLGPVSERLRAVFSITLRGLEDHVIRFVAPTWRYYSWGIVSKIAKDIGVLNPRPVNLVGRETDFKLVTFVSPSDLPKVRESLFSAGAGKYGPYSRCSFSAPGKGTFFGEKDTKPAYGHAGRMEEIDEERLEVVVPFDRVGRAISALRKVHPYEQPVIEAYQVPSPREFGEGRIGALGAGVTLSEVSKRISSVLGSKPVYVSSDAQAHSVMIWDGDPEKGLYEGLLRDADLYVGPDSNGLARLSARGMRTGVIEFPCYCFQMAGAKELVYMVREKSKVQGWGLRTFLPSKV